MTTKMLVSLAALTTVLAGTAAFAQSGAGPTGAIKPAEVIACELKGTCGEAAAMADPAGAVDADSPEAEVCRVDPQECGDASAGRSDGDLAETRGFSLRLAKPGAARAPTTRFAAAAGGRSLAGATGYSEAVSAQKPRYGVGRVNIASGSRARNMVASIKRGTAPVSTARYMPGARSSLAVGFEYDSATLDAMGRAQAMELLKVLTGKDFLGRRVIVAGHTDSLGDREYNLELSRRRAQTLVEFLSGNGVDRTLLEAKGFGFDDPLPGSSPRDGVNRRVEVMLKL